MTSKLLHYAGIKVVGANATIYDRTFIIHAKVDLLGSWYSEFGNIGGKFYHTGATLSGSIKEDITGKSIRTITFQRQYEPMKSIGVDKISRANSIDFEHMLNKMFNKHFLPKIVKMVGEVYGAHSLKTALRCDEPKLRASLLEGLAFIGNPVIEP